MSSDRSGARGGRAVDHVPGTRRAGPARAVDGVDLDARPRRDRRAGRRVRLRQDDAGAHPARAGAARRPARSSSTASRSATTAGRCKAYRRRVQLVLQDPTGSLNPRHTVYEAVAEGLRIHRVGGRRAGAGRARRCRGPGCGPPSASSCATRTSCPAASASGWSSPAPSRSTRRCSSPTSRCPRWTPRSAARSSRCCCGCATSSASRCSWSPTTSGWPGTSPTGSR